MLTNWLEYVKRRAIEIPWPPMVETNSSVYKIWLLYKQPHCFFTRISEKQDMGKMTHGKKDVVGSRDNESRRRGSFINGIFAGRSGDEAVYFETDRLTDRL